MIHRISKKHCTSDTTAVADKAKNLPKVTMAASLYKHPEIIKDGDYCLRLPSPAWPKFGIEPTVKLMDTYGVQPKGTVIVFTQNYLLPSIKLEMYKEAISSLATEAVTSWPYPVSFEPFDFA